MKKLNEVLDEKELKEINSVMYRMTKDSARYSFVEYLEFYGTRMETWEKFKNWLAENGIKTYL